MNLTPLELRRLKRYLSKVNWSEMVVAYEGKIRKPCIDPDTKRVLPLCPLQVLTNNAPNYTAKSARKLRIQAQKLEEVVWTAADCTFPTNDQARSLRKWMLQRINNASLNSHSQPKTS